MSKKCVVVHKSGPIEDHCKKGGTLGTAAAASTAAKTSTKMSRIYFKIARLDADQANEHTGPGMSLKGLKKHLNGLMALGNCTNAKEFVGMLQANVLQDGENDIFLCSHCAKQIGSKYCAGCPKEFSPHYCSRDCQVADWPEHKASCCSHCPKN